MADMHHGLESLEGVREWRQEHLENARNSRDHHERELARDKKRVSDLEAEVASIDETIALIKKTMAEEAGVEQVRTMMKEGD